MKVAIHPIEARSARTAVFSLPLPPFPVDISVNGAEQVQCVPLGEWPARLMENPRALWPWDEAEQVAAKPFGNPARRYLVHARFPAAVPDSFDINLTPGKLPAECGDEVDLKVLPVAGEEVYHKREGDLYHYVRREDSVTLSAFGKELSLRLTFNVNGELRYWQWTECLPTWSGPLSKAIVVGGHIYAGELDRRMTCDEAARFEETPFYEEATISAKAFIVAHADGVVELTVHFTNVQGYGTGCDVKGLPVVEVRSKEAIPENLFTVGEGTATQDDEGRTWHWMPVTESRIWIRHNKDLDTEEFQHFYVNGSETHFKKGVGRSSTCIIRLKEDAAPPRRCLPEPNWYKRCAEFGIALPEEPVEDFTSLQELSDVGVRVFLRNIHPDGMSRGGVYRYLDLPGERYELSMDGNESAFLFRGAYMRTHGDLYRAALDEARHIADICIDHNYFNVHYHGDCPKWELFSQIYLRFGGLVNAWQETGDPWYLENAEGVANRWIAINRMNQPRKNMGRDTEPVEGIMQLFEATGKDHYFREAEAIALDVANSLFDDGNWRSGFGVGPFWGVNALDGTPWNGTHLLAGIEEFLLRATPETSPHYQTLLSAACKLLAKFFDKLENDLDGFHRTSGAFMPRRHFLIAWLAKDETLMDKITKAIRRLEAEYEKDGEAFYKTGHHCAGYLEAPYVFRALCGNTPPITHP
jgi:hypothetical protein